MLYLFIYQSLFIFLLLHFFADNFTGLALQCWKCSSDFDITCRDHFNVTRIQQNRRYFEQINYSGRQQAAGNNPQLIHCDEMYTSSNYDTINVCMKREHTSKLPILQNDNVTYVLYYIKLKKKNYDLFDAILYIIRYW